MNTYTVENFRFTQAHGWVATAREADALLAYSIPFCEMNARDIRNIGAVMHTTFPEKPQWGDVLELSECICTYDGFGNIIEPCCPEHDASYTAPEPQTLTASAALVYGGYDLADHREWCSEQANKYPTIQDGVSSAEWFDGVKPVEY